MIKHLYYTRGKRAIGVCWPELFKFQIYLWFVFITFSWLQSPYIPASCRTFDIHVLIDLPIFK